MPSCGVRRPSVNIYAQIASSTRQMAGSRPNWHTMVIRRACIQDVLKVKVEVKGHVIWALFCDVKKIASFLGQMAASFLTKLSLSLISPFPLFVRFSSASQSPNGCEFALWVPSYLHGETVCQTVCYRPTTVRSDVLFLRALTFMKHVIQSFQTKYQPAKSNV